MERERPAETHGRGEGGTTQTTGGRETAPPGTISTERRESRFDRVHGQSEPKTNAFTGTTKRKRRKRTKRTRDERTRRNRRDGRGRGRRKSGADDRERGGRGEGVWYGPRRVGEEGDDEAEILQKGVGKRHRGRLGEDKEEMGQRKERREVRKTVYGESDVVGDDG